ncbi:MAG: 7-cyano-7-deazaguanine synthase [Nitrososphaerales archaeon]
MPRSKGKRDLAIVLLSGGLDSTVALYWAISKNFEPLAFTFTYPLQTRKERRASFLVAKSAGCRIQKIHVGFLKEIGDISEQGRVKLGKRTPQSYIPSRNLIFYGIASSVAEVIGAKYIIGGHNSEDSRVFPDSSRTFFKEFNKLTKTGLITGGKTGRVVLPLARLSKANVVELGKKLQVPFDLTWSCYDDGTKPCGKCSACKLRARAFRQAGLSDPLFS